jgi:hypothetical protein
MLEEKRSLIVFRKIGYECDGSQSVGSAQEYV